MPIPAVLASLGPLFAEAGGAAAAGGGAAAAGGGAAAALGEAGAATAASTAATEGLTSALTSALSSGGGGGPGGQTGYGLGGKVPGGVSGVFPAFAAIGKLVKPITSLPKKLEDWGQSLVDARRNLMAFNGAIAGTLLEAERRDIVRKMGEGQRLSGSTDFLSEGLSDLKDEFQPLKDVIVNGFNMVAGATVRAGSWTTWAIKNGDARLRSLLEIQEWLARRGDGDETEFMGFINNIRDGGLDFDDPNDNLMGGDFDRRVR